MTFDLFSVAASMANSGLATIGINAAGHGSGPLGTLTVERGAGDPVTFLTGGRGMDQDGDNLIGANEECFTAPSQRILLIRDCLRQTVADLMQLVRVIDVGMDVDGDGARNLDPARISYFGQSVGAMYGTPFLAVEPAVRAGVLNVDGGPAVEIGRLAPFVFRQVIGNVLAARVPSLINPPGIAELDGVATRAPRYNENKPLRSGVAVQVNLEDGTSYDLQGPVLNTVPGAMAIQEFLEDAEWLTLSGDPLGYVRHLREAPLPSVPAKAVIVQFATGDQSVPNPTTTALLRAGDLADRATNYRHDLAVTEDGTLPGNPHIFLTESGSANALYAAIARGAQEQVAVFFATDGVTAVHPEPARFFEAPIDTSR